MGRLLFFLIWSVALFANEPSMFDAGNLDANNPYGLSDSEKKIHDNAQSLSTMRASLYKHQSSVDALDAKLDGLNSILLDMDARLKMLEGNFALMNEVNASEANETKKDENLYKKVESLRAYQQRSNKELKNAIKALSKALDSLNKEVASKKNSSASLTTPLTGAQAYQKAHTLYKSKNYSGAKSYFAKAIEKNHKRASANFYYAQSAYHTKAYNDALKHYKQSASLNPQASYMATLILHSAICLEKGGDKANAKKFYQNLLANYASSTEASEAKRRLSKF